MDNATFAILNSRINSIESGIKDVNKTGDNKLEYEFNDGKKLEFTIQMPDVELSIQDDGKLYYETK